MNLFFNEKLRNSGILAITFFALVVLVLLPAGEYHAHGVVVKVNSLTSPFNDYGMLITFSAAIFVVFAVAVRLSGHRRHASPFGYILISGGVLGLMVPDAIRRGAQKIVNGDDGRSIAVKLLPGFWLTLAVTILLFVIAFLAFFWERNSPTDGEASKLR